MNTYKLGDSNKSDVYILPMLGELDQNFRSPDFPFNCYVNTFIGDTTSKYKDNVIAVLYKIPFQSKYNVKAWERFEIYLSMNPLFLELYKVDKYHIMFVFNVPDKWKEEYKLFKKWRPSLFSTTYKEHIRKFYNNIADSTALMQTLYKSEERFLELEEKFKVSIPRDQECSSSPYWENEYYQKEFKIENVLVKSQNE